MFRVLRAALFCFVTVNLLTACVARKPLSLRGGTEARPAPRFIELAEEQSISTVHFPRGLYSLDAEDARGYYYRSLGPVIKRSFAGFDRYEGGIFVAKNGRSVRGYIVWAGGYTRIGDLRRANYRFRG